MNNRVLKIVAGVLALGAVGVAFLGVKLSQQPPLPPQQLQRSVPPSPSASAVVALHALRAGQAITAADVTVRPIASVPDKGYTALADVVGRVPSVDIDGGEVLKSPQFASSSLASLLRPGERALAVKVDEVVGLGGFAQPGDRVDVLLFVQPSRETGDRSVSRLVIEDARLLTMGESSLLAEESTSSSLTASGPLASSNGSDLNRKNSAESKDKRGNQRSAVLALREADATRLMLASSAGQIRLALRPQGGAIEAKSAASAPTLSLNEVAGAGMATSPIVKSASGKPASTRSGGIIFNEGDKVRTMPTSGGAP